MTRGQVSFVEIRIVDTPTEVGPEGETTRQETSDIVEAAIVWYSARDPELSARRDERYRAYRQFIRDKGRDPNRERGFSPKTFEAYETKFRKKNKAK